jgi:hypothetical protein
VPAQRQERPAHLTGPPLVLARAAWLVTTIVSLGLLVTAIPLAYQQIITPQTGPQCADSRFSPAQFAWLQRVVTIGMGRPTPEGGVGYRIFAVR